MSISTNSLSKLSRGKGELKGSGIRVIYDDDVRWVFELIFSVLIFLSILSCLFVCTGHKSVDFECHPKRFRRIWIQKHAEHSENVYDKARSAALVQPRRCESRSAATFRFPSRCRPLSAASSQHVHK